MIFGHDSLQFVLLDVLTFDDTGAEMRTRPRPFCALSLRYEGDTDILLKNGTVHLTKHDLAFFPANVGYVRSSRRDRMIVFHFYLQNCVSYELEVLHDFCFDGLEPLFREARREWVERKPGYRYRASALLSEVFALICEKLDPAPRLSEPVSQALACFQENAHDPSLSVTGVAARLAVSETYLRRLFKRDLGVSPKTYLTDLRLERAQSLLNAGYDTVADVAEKVGFGDPKNFAVAFKKRFGYPPSAQHYAP